MKWRNQFLLEIIGRDFGEEASRVARHLLFVHGARTCSLLDVLKSTRSDFRSLCTTLAALVQHGVVRAVLSADIEEDDQPRIELLEKDVSYILDIDAILTRSVFPYFVSLVYHKFGERCAALVRITMQDGCISREDLLDLATEQFPASGASTDSPESDFRTLVENRILIPSVSLAQTNSDPSSSSSSRLSMGGGGGGQLDSSSLSSSSSTSFPPVAGRGRRRGGGSASASTSTSSSTPVSSPSVAVKRRGGGRGGGAVGSKRVKREDGSVRGPNHDDDNEDNDRGDDGDDNDSMALSNLVVSSGRKSSSSSSLSLSSSSSSSSLSVGKSEPFSFLDSSDGGHHLSSSSSSSTDPSSSSRFWRANIDVLIRHLRNVLIIGYVRERVGASAAIVLEALLNISLPFERTSRDDCSRPVRSAEINESLRTMTFPSIVPESVQHLEMMCTPSINVLSKSYTAEGPIYSANLNQILERVRNRAVEQYVMDKCGPEGFRVFRMLEHHKLMEEKMVSEKGMMAIKDARAKLHELHKLGFIVLQEVPRTTDHAPARTMYLWGSNLRQTRSLCLENCFQTICNLYCRLRHEQGKALSLLSTLSTVTAAQQEELESLQKIEDYVEVSILRISKLLFLIR